MATILRTLLHVCLCAIFMLSCKSDSSGPELIPIPELELKPQVELEAEEPRTVVSIQGDDFLINGEPTLKGRVWQDISMEGLLPNARMVQGIFDDLNPETKDRWAYPDSGTWDPDRNTREFVEAMEAWHRHGLLAFTINLQGGSPEGYSQHQPWHNSAFTETGDLRQDYLDRLTLILDKADELGMVVILGYFYFGQDERLQDEVAILHAVDEATMWILEAGYQNVIVEVANEAHNNSYHHGIFRENQVYELIERVQSHQVEGRRLLASVSFNGNTLPSPSVVEVSDYVLLHGNGVKNPARITQMVEETRAMPEYKGVPIVFNEDDHFNFDKEEYNMLSAFRAGASWGYFDYRKKKEGFNAGYQSVPVDWRINSKRKKDFFTKLEEITGGME